MKRFYIQICIGSIVLFLAVFGFIMLKRIQGSPQKTTFAEPVYAETPSKYPNQFTLTEYQENKAGLHKKYAALPFWENQQNDESTLRRLNMAIEAVKNSLEKNGEKPKSTEDILAYLNSLYQKWGDPQKVKELKRQTEETLQTAKESIQRLDFKIRETSDLKDRIKFIRENAKVFLAKRRELLRKLDEQAAKLDTLSDRINSSPLPSNRVLDDEDRNVFAESVSEITKGTTSPETSSQERLIPPSFPSQEIWHDHITSEVVSWNADFDERYLDVVIASYLTPEEFDAFFPTEQSRQMLQAHQEQMQTDIKNRVERLLSEDTGNREQKLQIIRQTLSENWSEEVAENVLEQLR